MQTPIAHDLVPDPNLWVQTALCPYEESGYPVACHVLTPTA